MRITTVNYQKVFPTAPYENERFGVEIQVDEGDSPEAAKKLAIETVDRWHMEGIWLSKKGGDPIDLSMVTYQGIRLDQPKIPVPEINRNDKNWK